MKILLLEDDLLLHEILEEFLTEKGHDIYSKYSGIDAEEAIFCETFDLLLLDVNVPGLNGFNLLKSVRKHDIKTPSILMTSLNQIEDIEMGFNSGCDDYIKKPFELKELNIRINNMKRLFNIQPDYKIEISENMYFDHKNLIIKRNDEIIQLTSKESQVLLYLINSTEPVGTEELCSNIWTYEEYPHASTIRTYIKILRKALGGNYIINIRGVGYKFNK